MKQLKYFCIFLFLLFFPILVEAKTKFVLPTLSVDEHEVCVPLTIQDYEEFQVIGIKIHYDNTKLSFQEGSLISLQNGFYHGLEEHDGVITIYAFNLTKEALEVEDNTLATMTFQWIDEEVNQIPLEIEVTDFSNTDLTSLEYEVINGMLTKNAEISLKEEVENQEDLSWSSSDESIASVDASGQVTFHKEGEVTIEARDTSGNVVLQKTMMNQEENRFVSYWWMIPVILVILGILCGGLIYVKKKKNKKIS